MDEDSSAVPPCAHMCSMHTHTPTKKQQNWYSELKEKIAVRVTNDYFLLLYVAPLLHRQHHHFHFCFRVEGGKTNTFVGVEPQRPSFLAASSPQMPEIFVSYQSKREMALLSYTP